MQTANAVEEALFKRAPDGWIFLAPNPWTLGARRTYLVNDAQKATLMDCVRRGRYLRLIPGVALVALAFLLAPGLVHGPSIATWLLLALLILAFAVAVNLTDHLVVRAQLAALKPSTERVGMLEMYRMQALAMPVWSLVTIVGCNALASTMLLASWLAAPHAPFALVAAVSAATSALIFAPMLVLRLRTRDGTMPA